MAIYFSGSSRAASPITGLVQGSQQPIMEFIADTAADITDLPSLDRCRGGSTAFVINTGQVFMLGENGWTEL